MKTRVKSIADMIRAWHLTGKESESHELLECGIRQFGDGMGITSVMTCADTPAASQGDEKACSA